MTQRINYAAATPGGAKALGDVYVYVAQCGLPATLIELVYLQVSQINGCAYCIDMHAKDARAQGETEQRLYLLPAWRESRNFYTPREQAALAWTEAVTLVSETRVPDEVYEDVRQHFSDDELIALTMAVVAINSWNRLNVSLRHAPGSYQPAASRELAGAAA